MNMQDEEDILAPFVDYSYEFAVGDEVKFGIMKGHVKEVLHARDGTVRCAVVDDEYECLHLRWETELSFV